MSSDMDGQTLDDRTLIIAIDFGTTYSGIAYGITEKTDLRVACSSWPASQYDHDEASGEKVPTTIHYLPRSGEFEWGFQIPEDIVHPDEIVRWFKLYVHATHNHLSTGDSNIVRGMQRPENTPDDIRNMLAHHDTDRLVTDYLSGLGEHILYFLAHREGQDSLDAFRERSAIRFVLTVPAVWKETAQDKTRQAFEKARGIGTLGPVTLVTEPEAAATFALHNMAKESALQVGQTFIVLDAGGGTVDIITYTITSLDPVLQVKEAASGAGDFCGAAFIDKAFADHLRATLGKEEDFDNEVLGHACRDFESTVKRQFSQTSMPNDQFTVAVPGMGRNTKLNINKRGRLTLEASEIHAMFEPYILKTIRLVKDQINTAKVQIEAVILVGGFGTSKYLRERLEKDIGEDMKVPIRATKESLRAVLYGAVMKGMEIAAPETHTFLTIDERVARRWNLHTPGLKLKRIVIEHYGIELAVPYDRNEHRELKHKRFWDGLDGCDRVRAMHWFIRHGDRVAESKPFYHHFKQVSKVNRGRPDRIPLTIYSDDKSEEAPVARNSNVKVLCHLEASLKSIPTSRIPVRTGKDGLEYYVLRCDIEVVCKC
ncbi:hypothetical protein PG984_004670 [Apiospora sp. TS-2023a]